MEIIQRLVKNERVLNIIVDNELKYHYMVSTNLENSKFCYKSVEELIKNHPEKHIIEDKLAIEKLTELQLPDVGYIRSDRISRLKTKDSLIPFGKLVAWNAFILNKIYPDINFTNVKGNPPFKRVDINQVLKVDEKENDFFKNEWLIVLNQFLVTKENLPESQVTDIVMGRLGDFIEKNASHFHNTDVRFNTICEVIVNERKTLEQFSPLENMELLLELMYTIGLVLDRSIIESLFIMYAQIMMFIDLSLIDDVQNCAAIPFETFRSIVLEEDSINLRQNIPVRIKGSVLRKESLYDIYQKIKNEDWFDLSRALALDNHNNEERFNKIYTLFLVLQKSTLFYYISFLASLLEKSRIYKSKTGSPKGGAEARKTEIHLVTKLCVSFKHFILDVVQLEKNEKLTLNQMEDFMNVNESDLRHLLNIITNNVMETLT